MSGYLTINICQLSMNSYPETISKPELVASATGYVTSTDISIHIGYIAKPNVPNNVINVAAKIL